MGRLFGTDGVRGIANRDLNCDLAFQIGAVGAYVLANEVHSPRILIGMDTRKSGPMLGAALSAGENMLLSRQDARCAACSDGIPMLAATAACRIRQ